jgi:hypothetical protein
MEPNSVRGVSRMNTARILAGGAVAGLIMNVSEALLHADILGSETEQLYKTLNVPLPSPAANVPVLIGATFLIGFAAVWLYAAIRPRFGAGARTAVIAGFAVWILSHVWSGVYLAHGYAGIIPGRLAGIPVIWGLFEATLATLAGAALYKEQVT